MNQQHDRRFGWNHLKQQFLLMGLSDEQILYLYQQSKEERFFPNEVIFEEGELTTDVYFILEGEISMLKWDEEHCFEALLGYLGKGESFGELSFMDNAPRSLTIKATKRVTLLKLTKEVLSSVKDILSQLYKNIALVTSNRLRQSHKVYVKNLIKNQQRFQFRQHIGQFLFYQYFIFSLVVVLISYFSPQEFQVYLPWLITMIPTSIMIKANQFEFSHFGMNFRNGISVIFVSLIAVVLAIGLLLCINLLLQSYAVPYLLFEWSPENILPLKLWPLYAVYAFCQEFIARGVLQKGLQEFLYDERGYQSLLINTVFLFLLLLPLGLQPAIHLSLVGLPMGLLYLKQKSILGIFLIHFLMICLGVLKI